MIPHKLTIQSVVLCFLLSQANLVLGQKQKVPQGGRLAVVVDERFAALRETPDLSGKLMRRLGRGRLVAVSATRMTKNGLIFCRVNVSRRTHGWIQRDALVLRSLNGDAQRLLKLIKQSSDFDRVVRARIFLDHFLHSPLRPEVLLLLGDAAEQASDKLSRDAAKRLDENSSAPEFSYFLNYSGLDRYNRQGVLFVFDQKSRRLHYDGAVWRELLRRFPLSEQAAEARKR